MYCPHIFTHNPHILAGCGRRCAASGRWHWCGSGSNGRLPAAADARPPAATAATDGGRGRHGGGRGQQACENRGGECTSGPGFDVAALGGGASTVGIVVAQQGGLRAWRLSEKQEKRVSREGSRWRAWWPLEGFPCFNAAENPTPWANISIPVLCLFPGGWDFGGQQGGNHNPHTWTIKLGRLLS